MTEKQIGTEAVGGGLAVWLALIIPFVIGITGIVLAVVLS